jgi:hypothetical protein
MRTIVGPYLFAVSEEWKILTSTAQPGSDAGFACLLGSLGKGGSRGEVKRRPKNAEKERHPN